MPVPQRVEIREVAMRDGLQNEWPIPLEAKLRLLQAISMTGVREVEVTAFVSASRVPAHADAEQLAAQLYRWPKLTFSALVASLTGARRAVAAGLETIEYVVSAADGHSHANVGRSSAEAAARISDIAQVVHSAGGQLEVIVATAWDCPFDGPVAPQRVIELADRAVDTGADAISLADTIGTTTPARVLDLVDQVRAVIGPTALGAHFHNTSGTGLASAYAALLAGVTRLDASVGGLGGCPFAPGASGNIATEELLYLLDGCGVASGLNLPAVLTAAELAQHAVDRTGTSNLLDAERGRRDRARQQAESR
ncbi:hydroxymethylglutaryl-CoA lyase [Nocardia sp. NBC_00565]|uniref:hydroxymethylglutaryl-CoA lyase n=1 Tax=Nocardia sp. NBC_00565 TaxID=2975993 RepID=UPI002E810194|nr:hydroxymethylglutaryl-CoA lyase [Nocardia sp. NBC_00565]WUC07816.1 hydroxymethylglutaryl-CoA lyase [Nocardia sp. NBC_00565]